MNSKGYFNIMKALANLLAVIMVEAGKVPVDSATKIANNVLKAVAGKSDEKQQ
jgi:hypothetical protein